MNNPLNKLTNTRRKKIILPTLLSVVLISLAGFVLLNLSTVKQTEPDFSKGVLTINTDRSVYSPHDKAELYFASLDSNGHTLCGSNLELEISDPEGEVAILSTSSATITNSPTCGDDNVSNDPDYLASLALEKEGQYKLKLTNKDSGKTFEKSIYVSNNNPFDIKRSGASRINPFKSERYPMVLEIKANSDYVGTIKDSVPASFEIIWQGEAEVTEETDQKILVWNVNLKAGESKTLSYEYKAPQVSPELHTLGPVIINNTPTDSVWLIASDSSFTGTAYTDEGTTPDTSASICAVVNSGTPACDATDGSGIFTIDSLSASAGDQITFFFDGGTEFGNTITVASSNGASSDWYNSAWTYRVKLTIDYTKIGADQTNFPVYVNLADLPSGFHSHVNQTDARDIRVTKADGQTELPREVVFYDSGTDTGEVHFQYTGTLSSSIDTDVYIYYGNSSASDYAVTDTYGAQNVWDSNYVGVWHMNESSSTRYDSTSNNNDLTSNGTGGVGQGTGQLGSAGDFESGDSDFLSITDALQTGLDLANSDYTMEWWLNFESNIYNNQPFINKYDSVNNNGDFYDIAGYWTGSANCLRLTHSDSWTYETEAFTGICSSGLSTGIWYYHSVTFDDSDNAIDACRGGSCDTPVTNSQATDGSNNDFNIGKRSWGSTWYLDGMMDEVRISAYERPSTWTLASYYNQSSSSTFYSEGSEETYSTGGDIATEDNLKVFQDHVIVRYEQGSSINITQMDAYDSDQNDTDMLFDAEDASPDTLVVENNNELYIPSGYTFAPGGNVTADDAKVVGTYTESSDTLAISGDFSVSGTFTASSGTVNYNGTTQTVAPVTYNNLTLSNSGAKTMTGVTSIAALNVSDSATMTSNAAFTVSGALTYSSSGSTTLASSTNISIGSFNQSNGTINDNGNTITVTGSSTPWTKSSGTFTASGTVVFNANADIATLLSGTVNFYNLTFSPTLTDNHSYTFGVAPTITGSFTINPSGAYRLTTYLSADTAVSGTTNLSGTGSGVSTLDTVSGQNRAFTTGILTIGTAGTLTANNSTITINGTSATIFSQAGTFNAGGSTVVISGSGAASLTAATTFNNLTVTGTPTTSNNFTINGNLIVSGSGNLSPSGGTVTMATSDWTIANSATLVFSGLTVSETPSSQSNTSYAVAGALTVNSGKTLAPAGGTITMKNGGSIVNNGGSTTNLVFKGLTVDTGATVTTSSSFSIDGALTNSSTATFNPSSGTITMSAVGSQIANSGTSLTFKGLTIAATPTAQSQYNTSYSVSGALTVNAGVTFTPTGGTITMATTGWSIVNSNVLTFSGLTIAGTPGTQPTASFSIAGALTVDSGITLSPTSGTITMTGGSIVNNGGAASNLVFNNLTFSGTTSSSSSFNIAGNWTNSGTFNQSAGVVTFNGSGAQQITGTNNSFSSLAITASSARTVTFVSSTVISVASGGSLTLQGAESNLLVLQSDGSDWYLQVDNAALSVDVHYVNVSHSNAASYKEIDASDGTNNDGGNNTNWDFLGAEPPSEEFYFDGGLNINGINLN